MGIWFRSYLNGRVVFPTFMNLSLNFAIRSPWSEPQSAPGLVFTHCIELLIFDWEEYNQSDFSIDHLVMSMCTVRSCVVGRGCLLWLVRSLGKTLLAFALLHSVLFISFWNTKGTFPAKMGTIKDRNGMDLTEAKDIKKRWQKYTEELYKKWSSWYR